MFEIRVIVDLPGIPAALNNLADALRGSAVSESEKVEQNNAVELYRKPDEPGESPAEKDAASVPAGDPLNVPEEMLPTEPVSPNPVPEKKREYTFNQISRAGANLCADIAKLDQLSDLLHTKYGVASIKDLDKSRYAELADDLIALGATIEEA